MARYFVFTFVDEKISARAVLLDKDAPQTCNTLWKHAPYEGDAVHAIYSGTTVGLLFDPTILIPMENATTHIQTRDLLFTHYDPMTRFGHPDGVSEFYWAYDRYCRPWMPGAGLPVCPNIFGQFVDSCDDFFAASRKMSSTGPKRLKVVATSD